MLHISALQPQTLNRPQQRGRKAVSERLLPLPAAGGSAENIAPAAFSPIWAPVIEDTGILFPDFFCPVSGWVVANRKDEVRKLPAIPVMAFPAVGEATFLVHPSDAFTHRSIFCSDHGCKAHVVRCVHAPDGRQGCNGGKPIEYHAGRRPDWSGCLNRYTLIESPATRNLTYTNDSRRIDEFP